MSKNKETNLIGFDPLVWLSQSNDQTHSEKVESAANTVSEIGDVKQLENSLQEDKVAQESAPVSTNIEARAENEVSSLEPEPVVETEEITAPQEFGQETTIKLEAVLNIRNVVELHERFCVALTNFEQINIDASAVMVIDTANLQLLLVLKQTSVKFQKQVTIDFPSEKFLEACSLLGLMEMLSVDQVASGFF